MSNTGKQRRRLVMLGEEGADTSGIRDVLEGQCDVEKRGKGGTHRSRSAGTLMTALWAWGWAMPETTRMNVGKQGWL